MSTNDKTFIHYSLILIFFLLIGFIIFNFIDYKKKNAELDELQNISYSILHNYTHLQKTKDMSCFVNLEFVFEQKKVKLFLDEEMNTVNCGEQIVQFTHYALKSPFTLELIEYP